MRVRWFGRIALYSVLLSGSLGVRAESPSPTLAHTPLFSIQVPMGWEILGNANGELVMGSRRHQGAIRVPMLLVQFCAEGSAEDGVMACPEPCDRSIRRISQHLGKTMYLEPLQKAEMKGKVTEYRTMLPDAPQKHDVTWIALSCSPRGQAFVTLVSDEPDQAGQLFDDMLRHLNWTTVPAQPSLRRAPSR